MGSWNVISCSYLSWLYRFIDYLYAGLLDLHFVLTRSSQYWHSRIGYFLNMVLSRLTQHGFLFSLIWSSKYWHSIICIFLNKVRKTHLWFWPTKAILGRLVFSFIIRVYLVVHLLVALCFCYNGHYQVHIYLVSFLIK